MRDLSDIRPIPDHQESFLVIDDPIDGALPLPRGQSLTFEIMQQSACSALIDALLDFNRDLIRTSGSRHCQFIRETVHCTRGLPCSGDDIWRRFGDGAEAAYLRSTQYFQVQRAQSNITDANSFELVLFRLPWARSDVLIYSCTPLPEGAGLGSGESDSSIALDAAKTLLVHDWSLFQPSQ